MYLCCVEILSSFRSKLDFLQIFKVAQKLGQSPCTIVHGLEPNFTKNEKERILHFYYFVSNSYCVTCPHGLYSIVVQGHSQTQWSHLSLQ